MVLGAGDLAATDVETANATLQFTVSGVTGGQFELVSNAGVAITTFTQAQLTAGDVQFVHDGNEAAPTYSVSVFDGALTTGPQAAAVTFTNIDDAPIITQNSLTISEGQTVVVGAGDLAATDVETADAALQFTVSGVTGGQFELVSNAGVAITTFTQAQLTAGDVQFVHDRNEAAPTYSVSVFDGALTTGPLAATITFTNVNDAPLIDLDADDSAAGGSDFATIWVEGAGPVAIVDADAVVSDIDSGSLQALTITIANLLDGADEVLAADTTGTAIVASYSSATGVLTLTGVDSVANYEQVLRTVTYDNASDTPATTTRVIDFVADDGALLSSTSTTLLASNATDDAPVITANALTVSEDGTVVLGATELAATDAETLDPALQFTVSSVTGGRFELVSNAGVAITTFTQAQLTAGDVQFVHDGNEAAPAYSVSVFDGALTTGPQAAAITFTNVDDAPIITANSLTISEGQTVVLGAGDLAATDVETANPTLQFTVSGVTGGQFELVSNAGVAITTFTQAQLTAGDVQFVHDGNEAAPTYSVSVFDGALTTGPLAATITFTNVDDAPIITANSLTISEGQTVVLGAGDLAATDAETANPALQFTVSGVTGGQFELASNAGVPITTFTQAQLTAGDVQFVHDGNEAAPTYSVSVFDGALTTGPLAATITFTNVNDAPTAVGDLDTAAEGATITIDLALNDIDPDDGLDLGSIVIVSGPANGSVVVNADGTVDYTHGGSETLSDSFSYTIKDLSGEVSNTATVNLTITPVDDAPILTANALVIAEGGTVVMTAGDLAATDAETTDAALQFTVSGVTGGQFELVSNPGVAITSFTQAQVTSGAVQFVHDGNEAAPTYSVSVFDGALTTGPLAATITFTNVDDAPIITANSLTISEGQTVVLGAGDLAAADVETANPALQFTVSGVTGGQFELVSNAGVAITTFTQAQLTAGDVQFVHDGNETAPTYSVSVFDGALTTGPLAATITFTNVDDAPIITQNTLTLSEGQTVVLGAGDLAATDVETVDSALQFTVSGVTGGQFELVSNAGVAITTFTQAQLAAGDVQFVHNGNEAAPTYSVSVFDGALTTGPLAATITFTNVDDAPIITQNTLTISEGETVVLGAGDLAATDVETVDSALQFTVSGVTGGQFELVSNAGVAITTFTQAQLAAGDVQFVHNGNEAAPTYSVSVFDGALTTGPLAATITFTNVDDAPIITQNTLTISEGETVVLGAGDLAATDVETVDSALQFTVSGVTGGQFELVSNAGVAITTFTQAQLTAGDVQFVHDGNEAAPTYSVSVFDGALTTGPLAATITFTNVDDAPIITQNTLTLSEGQTVVLGAGDLAATDVETVDSALEFTVSGVTGGQFELVSNAGVAITAFTQAQLTAGDVQFVHDGNEAAPTYSVSVFDGALTTGPQAAAVTFTNIDDAPIITANTLTISEGQTVVLGAGDLAATDVETADAALQFTVSGITGGQFELVSNAGVAITTFTQAQLTAGDVQFVHDGNEAAPAYSVSVFDGALTTGPQAAAITFTNVDDAPIITANSLTISEGQTVVLGAGDLAATDVETANATLQFTVSGVTGGQFELESNAGVAITTVTQAQLTAGDVQFVHDGNEAAPTYSVSVFDGALATGPLAATITFTNVDDAPIITANSLTISEGQTVVLGAGDLAATDVETADAALQFTVSGVTGGQFELVSNAGVAITTFTQAQLSAGDVQFVHDGNEAAPTYSVSVFDGALTTGPLAATITFTNVDDAPIITQNTLTISEGETVVLGAGDLAATDVETANATLQFTVSGVTGGQFELVSNAGVAITTFTQAQLTAGDVQFVHDGNEAAPTYSVSVFDGALTTGPLAATINFTNVDDAPIITQNTLTLSEGQTVVLGAGDLAATDVETADAALQFTVSGVTGGQFELVSNAGVAITAFTQAQLTAGDVQFVHDGNEAAPTYSVSVFDGALTTGPLAATITFTNVDDAPIITQNTLTLSEGQTVVLGAGDLAATDVETADAALQFTVSGVTGGQFELVSNAGVAITTFTQAQLTAGDVQFVHDGNEAAPTYSVSVFDGALTTGPLAATITFTNVDDAPIITQNTLTLSEGQTVVLGAGDLAATDVETADAALQFTVSGVTGGQFELVSNAGVAITTFTQAQLTAGDVQFVHDGNEAAPTYSVSVFDGALTTGPQAAAVTFTNVNDAPALDLDADDSAGAGGLDFSVGWTEGLGPIAVADTDAVLSDPDSPTLQSVTVTITNPFDGALEVLAADTTGTAIVATYTPATGTLILSGADTPAAYQQVLRTVTYDNASLDPDATPRLLAFVADDGLLMSPVASTVVGITPVNDAPTAAPDAYTPTEDTAFTTTAATGVLANDADPDSVMSAVLISGRATQPRSA